ncbi:MAG: glutathione S-transferase family protein [Polyangiaceae bacterium]|nr:glutathione S-transferase family protein [Polyangiaceae bacterium]
MSKPKLTYFDIAASRGEECRLALYAAGVDFEDNRIKRDAWMALKPTTPFGSLPVFEVEGHPPLGQSNAILVLIGREHGLHPKDNFEAARHEAMMAHIEDLRVTVARTMHMTADEEKKKARAELAASYIPTWAAYAEKQIGDGPFFGGDKLNVVDIKIYIIVRWFVSGALDHMPTTVFSAYPKLNRVYEAVRDHERVKSWYARSAA